MTTTQDIESCAGPNGAVNTGPIEGLCPALCPNGVVLFLAMYYDQGSEKRPASVLEHACRPNPLSRYQRAKRASARIARWRN